MDLSQSVHFADLHTAVTDLGLSHETVVTQLKKIFFETSSKTDFSSEDERTHFQYKYLDVYLQDASLVFLALAGKQVVGYLAGCAKTTDEHFSLHPYLKLFPIANFANFPAHFHINLTAKSRGHSVGSSLLKMFEEAITTRCTQGLHLVTLPGARNVSFYTRNDYTKISTIVHQGTPLLMLGKPLLVSKE